MKTLILLTLCAIMTLSCNDKKATFDSNTRMIINPDKSLTKAVPDAPYSVDTIMRYAYEMANTDVKTNTTPRREIMKRDIVNKKLTVGTLYDILMYVNDVPMLGWIITDGAKEFVITAWRTEDEKSWMDAYNAVDLGNGLGDAGVGFVRDTIGYVPSLVLAKAREDITNAFNAEDYDLCSALFDEAFTFVPITGEQWREKKANGTL